MLVVLYVHGRGSEVEHRVNALHYKQQKSFRLLSQRLRKVKGVSRSQKRVFNLAETLSGL